MSESGNGDVNRASEAYGGDEINKIIEMCGNVRGIESDVESARNNCRNEYEGNMKPALMNENEKCKWKEAKREVKWSKLEVAGTGWSGRKRSPGS